MIVVMLLELRLTRSSEAYICQAWPELHTWSTR
jgi:hypothetical protein